MLGQLAAAPLPAAASAAEPNVGVIISDEQGWADYRFMGHLHIATPALDKLAVKLNAWRTPVAAAK